MKKILMLLVGAVVAFAANATLYVCGNDASVGSWNPKNCMAVPLGDDDWYTFTAPAGKEFQMSKDRDTDQDNKWDKFNSNILAHKGDWSEKSSTLKEVSLEQKNNDNKKFTISDGYIYVRVSKDYTKMQISKTPYEELKDVTYTIYFYSTSEITENIYAHIFVKDVADFDKWGTVGETNQLKKLEGKQVKDGNNTYDVYGLTFTWNRKPSHIIVYNGSSKYIDDSEFQDGGIYKKGVNAPMTNVTIEETNHTYKYALKSNFPNNSNSWDTYDWFKDEDGDGVYELEKQYDSAWSGSCGIDFYIDETYNSWYSADGSSAYTASTEGTSYNLKKNGTNWSFTNLHGKVTFTLTPNADGTPGTLKIAGGQDTPAVWSYSINNSTDKTVFTTSTGEITVNANDVVYLWKDSAKQSTIASGDVTVSGDIDATALVAADGGFKASVNGKMTLTLSDNNSKVAVAFTEIHEIPSTLWFGYEAKADGSSWQKVELKKSGDKFVLETPVTVTENQIFYWRFGVNSDKVLTWNVSNDDQIFAPNNNPTVMEQDFESANGKDCWKAEAPKNGTYSVEAYYVAWNKIHYTVTFNETVNTDPDPTPTDKVLYMAYDNGHTNMNNYKWVFATAISVEGNTYKYDIPVFNDHSVYFRFMTSQDCLKEWNNNNDDLIAPNDPNNVNKTSETNYPAGQGHNCWYYRPNAAGVYHVTATLNDNGTLTFNLVFEKDQVSNEGVIYYMINDSEGANSGAPVAMPSITVPGQFTQWSVILTLDSKWVSFKVGSDNFGIDHNDNWWLKEAQMPFKGFKANGKKFYFDGNRTFQIIVRKFDTNTYGSSEGYQITARPINNDNFTEHAFTESTDLFTNDNVTASLGDAKAAAKFCVNVEFDEETGMMKSTKDVSEDGIVYHWVKYEHPFWGASSASQMSYNGTNWDGKPLSVAEALYYSDTYLHATDPRLKYHFTGDLLDWYNAGKRNHSVDKASTGEFKPNSALTTGDSYYRVYVTCQTVDQATPANAPHRAPITPTLIEEYGQRVAFAAPLPSDAGGNIVSGVEGVLANVEVAAEAEYYTISGVRVYGEPAPGLYIVRRGNKVTKELVK